MYIKLCTHLNGVNVCREAANTFDSWPYVECTESLENRKFLLQQPPFQVFRKH